MDDVILSNQARCKLCLDEPYSAFQHDYKHCKCGEISVDGGMSYLRRGYKNKDNLEEMSIVIDELTFETAMSALEWADNNNRNNLGKLCAVFIALRSTGFLDGSNID